jgi:competence protein ComEA
MNIRMLTRFVGVLGLIVGALAAGSVMAQTATHAPSSTTSSSSTMSRSSAQSLVDINSASESDLDALPGVGKTRAAAIIKGRPYNGKDDLVNRHILPKNVYDGIKDKIIAKRS